MAAIIIYYYLSSTARSFLMYRTASWAPQGGIVSTEAAARSTLATVDAMRDHGHMMTASSASLGWVSAVTSARWALALTLWRSLARNGGRGRFGIARQPSVVVVVRAASVEDEVSSRGQKTTVKREEIWNEIQRRFLHPYVQKRDGRNRGVIL